MTIPKLITSLKKDKISLKLVHDQLVINVPKENASSPLIQEVRNRKAEIVAFLKSVSQNEKINSVESRKATTVFDVSPAQKRLWILHQLNPGLNAYNMPNAFVIEGVLNIKAIEYAFKTLIERHEILRTSFVQIEGEVKQKVNAPAPGEFSIAVVDLRGESNPIEMGKKLAAQEAALPFDLEKAPLFRVKILRLEDNLFALVLVFNHIISDGWSGGVIIREISILYNAFCKDNENPLPPLEIQFRDYVNWQNLALASEAAKKHKDYWLKIFAGELPILNLYNNQKRPPVRTYNGDSIKSIALSEQVTTKLNQLSQNNNCTLFTTILSILNVLFYKVSGQTDIILGTNSATRTHKNTENNIGLFLDILCLRNTFSDDRCFLEFLGDVRNGVLEAFEHQIYPFELIVSDLNIKRDISRSPLFDVLVIFQNFNSRLFDENLNASRVDTSLRIDQYDIQTKSSLVDLELTFNEDSGRLFLNIRYNTDLFAREYVERLGKYFTTLVRAILDDPNRKLHAYDVVDEAERSWMLFDVNNTAKHYPKTTIQEHVEEQVRLQPDATALTFLSQSLTYDELNCRANKMAHVLRDAYAIGPDDVVALSLERSEWMVIIILAIIKAGGAYLPIEVSCTDKRRERFLFDSNAKVLITEEHVAQAIPSATTVVSLDELIRRSDRALASNPVLNTKPDDLLYVMFTSGSSGFPKGVLINHSSCINLLQGVKDVVGIESLRRILFSTSYTFDISVLELFLPLIAGGEVVVWEPQCNIKDCIVQERPTTVQATPSFWTEILNAGWMGDQALTILCGGEQLTDTLATKLRTHAKRVLNMYGPTETTIWSTCCDIVGDKVSIGKAIANTQVYVLDNRDQLVPTEAVGEICIGGHGLARGYLNAADLSVEKFQANPFAEGSKLYRTGDLGRLLSNGTLQYLGRKDKQIKIDGRRVEPDEIRHVLLQHPEIHDAVVFAKKDEHAGVSIVSYITRHTANEEVQPYRLSERSPSEGPISESDLLLLDKFNSTNKALFSERGVHEIFEDQAVRNPHRIAMVCHDRCFSYGYINDRANVLASRLCDVNPEDAICVLLERSEWLLISILAIWKVGATYVPLEINYPPGRMVEVIRASSCKSIISTSAILDRCLDAKVQGSLETKLVRIENLDDHKLDDRQQKRAAAFSANNLAYIIFTSGSTGKPKGVMIEHLGMLNHLQAKIDELNINASTVLVQNASAAFDISIWQFFAALMVGGRIAIYDSEFVFDVSAVARRLEEEKVTILEVVPSYLREMLRVLDDSNAALLDLEFLVVTGETLHGSLANRWTTHYPNTTLVNAYGPTEASDDISHHFVDGAALENSVSIGKPIQNLRIYIVDKDMNLCPIGTAGEICVSGVGVGRGYLNNPEATRASFMEDPFRTERGVRLYKTGDIGRCRSNGEIEFFGRIDSQVKIRGGRVEVAEIENQFFKIEGIRNAVVVLEGGNQLIAYLLLDDGRKISEKTVRTELRHFLPDYMIPNLIIVLDTFPYLTNGKIDRSLLPMPQSAHTNFVAGVRKHVVECVPSYMVPKEIIVVKSFPLTTNGKIDYEALGKVNTVDEKLRYKEPRTVVEKKLVSIWEEVLNHQRIGIEESFFELGGHSLKAIDVISKIHKTFTVRIALKELFDNDTIETLASVVEASSRTNVHDATGVSQSEHYDISHAQKLLWIQWAYGNAKHVYNIPMSALITGELDQAALEKSVNSVVERHENLRCCFRMIDGVVKQTIRKSLPVQLNVVDLRGQRKSRLLVLEHARKLQSEIFDLENGPLFRVSLLRVEDSQYVFLFTIHHIVSDGWSLSVLRNDLLSFYNAYAQGRAPLVAPLTMQFKDHLQALNGQLNSVEFERQKNYWINQLSGCVPVSRLPYKSRRPEIKTFAGASKKCTLSRPLRAGLAALGKANNVSLFVVALASIKMLLYRYSQQDDITVGTSISGRYQEGAERLIGYLVNTLALRTKIDGDDSFEDLLKNVGEVVDTAYQNKDYPFDSLRGDVKAWGSEGRSSLFDVMVVLFGDRDHEIMNGHQPVVVEPVNIVVDDYEIDHALSQFDLTFIFTDDQGDLSLKIDFNTDLFEPDTISEMLRLYERVVAEIVRDSKTSINKKAYPVSHECSRTAVRQAMGAGAHGKMQRPARPLQRKDERKFSSEKKYYEASHGQKGLIFKYLLSKKRMGFNMILIHDFQDLDMRAYERAMQMMLERHEILRTTFKRVGGDIVAHVRDVDELNFKIEHLDFRHIKSNVDTMDLRLENDVQTVFDIENGPLIKLKLFQFGGNAWKSVFIIDHVISDATSLKILEREFFEIYASFKEGRSNTLPEARNQYGDYASWQNRFLNGADVEPYRKYWKEKFEGEIPAVELPTDYSNQTDTEDSRYRSVFSVEAKKHFKRLKKDEWPALQGLIASARPLEGASYRVVIGEEMLVRLKELVVATKSTLFAVLTTSINLLLYKTTGQKDVTVGSPVSLRNHEDFRGVVGWFLNTILIRNKVDERQTIAECIRAVFKNTTEALAYSAYPFERILNDMNLPMDAVGRVFIHLMNFEGSTGKRIANMAPQHKRKGTPTFDINFTFTEFLDGIELVVDYRNDLFKPETIELTVERYFETLEVIVSSPEWEVERIVNSSYAHQDVAVRALA